MSMIRRFTVVCDYCGNEAPESFPQSLNAIVQAKADGYHIYGKKTVCPSCWEKGVRYDHIESVA